MNKLPLEKRVQILSALCEGSSMRSTSRMAGVSINTVTKLLIDAGYACARFQHEVMMNLPCKRLQCDEIWGFCYAKAKNVPEELRGIPGYGDVWTFTAICDETKLVPCWLVGGRDACFASRFLTDLAGRLANRVQLTTDGHRMYLEASDNAFGGQVDYAQLVKMYGNPPNANAHPETRYSPGESCGTETHVITGSPDPDHISTSYVERQNKTMRMRMRRFTRLTDGFSKKLENMEHAIALYFFHYNFIARHKTLRMPPALKARVADHLWTYEDLAGMIDRYENERNSN
jgi:IS1 family transposase